jgi:hypothetical protein
MQEKIQMTDSEHVALSTLTLPAGLAWHKPHSVLVFYILLDNPVQTILVGNSD